MPAALAPSRDETTGVIALDLGGTKLAACVFMPDGQPQYRNVVGLEQRAGLAVGEVIAEEVKCLQTSAAAADIRISGVAVAVPGIADKGTGRVWVPNIPGWDDYPLRAELESAVANPAVRVAIDSDRAAYILGEAWQGAARGCPNAIFLAVGTGIGAGILADGRLVRGAGGVAGSIGWLALDRPFQPEYESWGCFETYASGAGLGREFAQRVSAETGDAIAVGERPDARDLFAAYDRGDAHARLVIRQAIEFWGMAAANLVSLFDPEKIIFGGGVFGPATRFIPEIAVEAKRWAQPISMARVEFAASQLGSDAGLYGAGYLALCGAELIPPTA